MAIILPFFISRTRIILALYILLATAAMHGQIASGVVDSDGQWVRNAPTLQSETVDNINTNIKDNYYVDGMSGNSRLQ